MSFESQDRSQDRSATEARPETSEWEKDAGLQSPLSVESPDPCLKTTRKNRRQVHRERQTAADLHDLGHFFWRLADVAEASRSLINKSRLFHRRNAQLHLSRTCEIANARCDESLGAGRTVEGWDGPPRLNQ